LGRTSSKSKNEYNESAYGRYTIRIRKDTLLYDVIEEFMSFKGTSFNYIVTKALEKYFAKELNDIYDRYV